MYIYIFKDTHKHTNTPPTRTHQHIADWEAKKKKVRASTYEAAVEEREEGKREWGGGESAV
jgi:hypothetical protein